MTPKLIKISSFVFFYLASVAMVMQMLQSFSGFSLSESLKDPASVVLALSFPLFLWGTIKIVPSNAPSFVLTAIYITVFIIWGYFAYQLMTYTDYSLTDIPTDIMYGFNWVSDNKRIVGLYFILLVVVICGKWVGRLSERVFGEELDNFDGGPGYD